MKISWNFTGISLIKIAESERISDCQPQTPGNFLPFWKRLTFKTRAEWFSMKIYCKTRAISWENGLFEQEKCLTISTKGKTMQETEICIDDLANNHERIDLVFSDKGANLKVFPIVNHKPREIFCLSERGWHLAVDVHWNIYVKMKG